MTEARKVERSMMVSDIYTDEIKIPILSICIVLDATEMKAFASGQRRKYMVQIKSHKTYSSK